MILYVGVGNNREQEVEIMNGLENNFRTITPYTPGDQPRFKDKVKLNTNENP